MNEVQLPIKMTSLHWNPWPLCDALQIWVHKKRMIKIQQKNNKCQIKPIALLNWNFQTGLTDPGEPMTTHGIPYPYIVLYHIRFSFFAVELITLLSDYPTSETTAFHMDAFFQRQVDLMNTIFTHGTWKKNT